MVTSKMGLQEQKSRPDDFPALYLHIGEGSEDGLVVLFGSKNSGVIVCGSLVNPTGTRGIGWHSAVWAACTDTEVWKRQPYGTTVTLTQGQ